MYWYENDVKNIERIPYPETQKRKIAFYGSSSIRLWGNLENEFTEICPINLGFGGSTLAACSWFFERIVPRFEPDSMIVYAGDNDLGDGRHPEEVWLFFMVLLQKYQKLFPDKMFTFLSIKPSPIRWQLVNQIRYTNQIIFNSLKDLPNTCYINIFDPMLNAQGKPELKYFEPDKLHVSREGYNLWKKCIYEQSLKIF